jgi:hypothetical protein
MGIDIKNFPKFISRDQQQQPSNCSQRRSTRKNYFLKDIISSWCSIKDEKEK